MTSLLDLLKRPVALAVLGAILGLIVGVPLGWSTVRVVNTTPAVMRPDLQEDYLRMAIESFQVDQNPHFFNNSSDGAQFRALRTPSSTSST